MVDTKTRNGGVPRLDPAGAFVFLREQFTAGRAGSGRLVLVSGNVACGKTWLLNAFLDSVERDGTLALSAVGAVDEQSLDCGVIDQLLSGPGLPDAVVERAHHIIAALRDEGDAASIVTPLLGRLGQALLDLARERPLVVVVDDVHLADGVSVLLLQHLQRRLRPTKLTIVLSLPDGPRPAELALRITRHAHHPIRLAPLSEQAVREMIGGDDGLAARIHQLGAGNPLLVNALVEDHRTARDISGPATTPGPAFRAALASYLDRCEPPLREVAGALAVFGRSASAPVLAALTGVSTGVAERAGEALDCSGLLTDGWFRHPRIESAVRDGLPPEVRAAAQLRAAGVKFRQAAPPKEVADHLIAAGSADPPWAIPLLREAAGQAAAADDVDFARQCLELGLARATTDLERRSLLAQLARHTWRMSPSAADRQLSSLRELPADGLPEAVERAEAAVAVRNALWDGDEAAYHKEWQAAVGRADGRTRMGVRLAQAWWFGPQGADASDEVPADDPWHQTVTELSRFWYRSGNEASTAAAERLLRNCRLDDDSLEALMTAVLALVHANRMDDAETWWRSLKAEADRRGAVTWQAVLTGMWASAVLRAGDVTYAAELARHALSLLPAQDWGAAIGDPLATLLFAWTAAGEYERAADVLARDVPDGMSGTLAGIRFTRARGHYRLATGQLLAAVDDFTACGRMLAARGADLPVVAPWRADLAAASLVLGNLDAARGLAAEQLRLTAGTDAHTRGLAMRVLALAGEPDDLHDTLRQAAEKFTESGDRWEAYRTARMLDRFSPQRVVVPRPGAPVPDRVAVFRSVALAAVVGRGLSATARTEPEGAGGESISAAERRVAELAARAMTNQEISDVLAITVSTVEQHLTRVYRKLGIRGRAQLAAKLGADY
nr:AAA family ATPase [Streptomyces sp. NBC_00886]